MNQTISTHPKAEEAFNELQTSIYSALETYSNVHRGSGQYSIITTSLYEEARGIVLDHLKLNGKKYQVIFCSPFRAEGFMKQLKAGTYQVLSSAEVGLPIGVRAVAVRKNALPGGAPVQSGGGAARLIAPEWVVWANAPERFEAGTPAVINVIAFVKTLKLTQKYGGDVFSSFNMNSTIESILQDGLLTYEGRDLLERLRKTLIGRDVKVPASDGLRRYVNLDNAASTQTFEPVFNSFIQAMKIAADKRETLIEKVREITSGFLNAPSSEYDIIFTSNATEAVNLAAENFREKSESNVIPIVLSSILEHSSNDLPWRDTLNTNVVRVPVDDNGFLDLIELDKILHDYNNPEKHGTERIKLVAISGASNVLGTCNRVAEISSIVHKYGALLLVDAAQLVAHRKTDVNGCGIDFLVFSAHKAYAPFGTGALVARKKLLKLPAARLKQVAEAGEENIAGIAAMGMSLLLLQNIGTDLICEEEEALTNHALRALSDIAGLKVFGINKPGSDLVKNKTAVIPFFSRDVWPDKIARELAARGIGVRYGCHCAHMLVKHLHKVTPAIQKLQHLIAITFPRMVFPGVVRISFGLGNSIEDIDTFVENLQDILAKKKREKSDVKSRIEEFTRTVSSKVYGN